MTSPAVRDHQSPLEAVLVDVRATLADLLVAADEQHAALVARDHVRLESVTRQQERLSARLARAEATRRTVLNGETIDSAIAASTRAQELYRSIASAVRQLKDKHARATSLLEQSVELTSQTLNFLQRMIIAPNPVYSARGISTQRHSVLVDGRA